MSGTPGFFRRHGLSSFTGRVEPMVSSSLGGFDNEQELGVQAVEDQLPISSLGRISECVSNLL